MDDADAAARRRDRSVAAAQDPLTLVRRRLLRQSFVFDDPTAYAAGVEDTIAAVRDLTLLERRHDDGPSEPVRHQRAPIRGAVG